MVQLVDRVGIALADRFRVEREMGHGAMGIVLLAHDLRHGRNVALKVLRPELAQETSLSRFLREIRITAQLQHPNILPLLDSGEADGIAYYVTPYVAGESLRARLEREHRLPIADAVRIACEIADALEYAHSLGFVHRDIKPENILLSAGHALVADFGIAHLLRGEDETLTATGLALGTPTYMSPEQATGESGVDHRSDIYALACVLYEMVSGTTPFTGTAQAILAQKVSGRVPQLGAGPTAMRPHVEAVVKKALATLPADRFSSAREMADALGQPGSRSSAPRVRLWLIGSVAAALAAGAVYMIVGRRTSSASASPPRAQFAQLTGRPGIEAFPSLSPDGKWLVYSGQERGNRDIYLQSVSGQTAINLTEDSADDDDQPAFSPDGELIAFRSSRAAGGIFVMGRTGEGVRRISDRGFRPTWSPDGSEIAFATANVDMVPGNYSEASDLWVVNVVSGATRRLPSGDATLPSWSPHGDRIAFAPRFDASGHGGLKTISRTGGEPVVLTSGEFRDWGPTWSPDGRHVYFSSDRGGSMNLWRVAVDEKSGKPVRPPEPVTTPATFLAHAAAGADAKHIAYTSSQVEVNVHRIQFDPGRAEVRGSSTPVTSGTRQWSSPDPSPDGQHVAFYTLNQPEGDLYVARVNGGVPRQVTTGPALDRLPRWSPDGQWLAFFSDRDGPFRVWVIGADGRGLRRLTESPSNYSVWAPDGNRLALVMGLASRGETLAVVDPHVSAAEQRVEVLPASTVGRFLVNSWSPDGGRLAGQIGSVSGAGQGVAIYTFATRRYEKLTDFGEWPVWLPDGQRIVFVANGNAYYVADARTRAVRKIYSVDRGVLGPPRVSADGGWLYFSRRVTEADIWLLTLDETKQP